MAAREHKSLVDEIKKAKDEVKQAKSSGPSKETVSMVVRETAELAIESGLKKIDSDHVERQKRTCNVVIKRVEEHSSEDKQVRLKYDTNFVTEKLTIPAGEILHVWRAGPRYDKDNKKRTFRPLIVQLMDKASAEYWHRNGRGREVNGHYINQDLCAVDRHANFLAREEFRKRKEGRSTPPPQSAT